MGVFMIMKSYLCFYEISGEIGPIRSRAMSSCLLNFLRGFLLIRSVILALLAFVAAVLIAINYVWRGEWGKARERTSSESEDECDRALAKSSWALDTDPTSPGYQIMLAHYLIVVYLCFFKVSYGTFRICCARSAVRHL